MSKDIIIQKNGDNYTATADKIRTDKIGGGTVDWVPEEGTELTEKHISENGTYTASDDGYYGYSVVHLENCKEDSKVTTKTKYITENGVYKAKADDCYAFSEISVNVRGGGSWTDPDTGETHTPDPSNDEGSSIVGEDEDGNEEKVTVDKDGKLKKEKLASYILIDTPPDKLIFSDGETIDFTGAVVRGYLKDGMPYKNQSYGESIINHSELTLDPTEAEWGQGGGEWIYPDYDSNPTGEVVSVGSGLDAFEKAIANTTRGYTNSDAVLSDIRGIISQYEGVNPVVVQATRESRRYQGWSPLTVYIYTSLRIGDIISGAAQGIRITTYGDALANQPLVLSRYKQESTNSVVCEGIEVSTSTYKVSSLDSRQALPDKQTITVSWPREGDGKILSTTYEITVNK